MNRCSCIIHIKDGQIANKIAVRKLFEALQEGRYKVTIEKSNKRSLPQNAFLHGVLIPEFKKALNDVGYDEVKTNEQAKEIMKNMFLKRQAINKNTGEALEYVQHTSELTTIELNILIEEVIKFSAEHMNYEIPYPNEQLSLYE